MKEVWKLYTDNRCYRKDGTCYQGAIYEVSNYGRVKRNKKLIKSIRIDSSGYPCLGSIKLSRIVAELFIPNIENKPEVDHIDTNKLNNKVENLRWVTHKENMNNIKTRENISISRKGCDHHGDKNPMFGKKQSEESKIKDSEAHKGNKYFFGKKHSIESLQKMRINKLGDKNPMFGRKQSEETRQKMREAWVKRRANKNILKN